MLDKMKGLGNQLTTLAGGAVDGVRLSVRESAGNLADAAGAAATSMNEKAIRSAVEQMRTILRIAAEELEARPVSERPVTLTASVDIGIAALEMQVVMTGAPSARVADPGRGPAPDAETPADDTPPI